jgi:hypothetical protein
MRGGDVVPRDKIIIFARATPNITTQTHIDYFVEGVNVNVLPSPLPDVPLVETCHSLHLWIDPPVPSTGEPSKILSATKHTVDRNLSCIRPFDIVRPDSSYSSLSNKN